MEQKPTELRPVHVPPATEKDAVQPVNPPHDQQSAYAHAIPLTTVKTLLSWTAPGRPFRKRGKEYFLNILVITFAVQVILFLFSQYILMVLVAALVFLTFALATVPPNDLHYKITTQGVTIEEYFYYWNELFDFYFKNTDGVYVLHVTTKAYMPGELTLTLGGISVEHVKTVLLPYLHYREIVTPSFLEKSGDWLSKTFPLEKQTPHAS